MQPAGAKLLRGLLEVFLLESLEKEPKHGYAMLKELAEAFGSEPNRNRLYPLLGRMVKEGLVQEVSEADGGRTIYALTDAGHEALRDYRRLPRPFRDALGRIWSLPPPAPADAGEPAVAAPRALPVRSPSRDEAALPPRPAATPHESALPYPCPEARVTLTKDPRTGDLGMRLTGCPMGAYSYCGQCPVFQSVEGLRRVVFSV